MTRDVHLNVLLPKNRNHPGRLRIEVSGIPKAEFPILGRGSTKVGKKPTGNPSLNPYLYAGNTPTGTYTSQGLEDTSHWEQSSYGPWGAVQLRAVSGDALVAEKLGRTGLLIHGGAPGRFEGFRSTLGCLRLSNDDMFRLRNFLLEAAEDPQARACTEISVTVTVRDW